MLVNYIGWWDSIVINHAKAAPASLVIGKLASHEA